MFTVVSYTDNRDARQVISYSGKKGKYKKHLSIPKFFLVHSFLVTLFSCN